MRHDNNDSPGKHGKPGDQLAPPDAGPRRNAEGTYRYTSVHAPYVLDQEALRTDPQALISAGAKYVADVELDTADLTPVGPGTYEVLYSPDGLVSIVASRECRASPQTAKAMRALRSAIEPAAPPATVATLLENARAAARACGATVPERLEADALAIVNGKQ